MRKIEKENNFCEVPSTFNGKMGNCFSSKCIPNNDVYPQEVYRRPAVKMQTFCMISQPIMAQVEIIL